MNRRSRAALAVLFSVSLAPLPGCGAGDTRLSSPTTRETASAARVEQVPFPLPVVEMDGTGEQMGAAHGERLGPVIKGLHDKYLKAYFSSEGERFLAMAAAAGFEQRVSPEHLKEIRSLAKSSGVDARQMMLAHCFLDLSPMTACSTVTLPASASPDGVARFGRNLDFPSFNVADKLSVV